MRASSPWLATTHGAPTRSRRRYASPPRSRDPVGTPDDGVRARGVRGARRGARARPTRLHPSGGCAECPRARDRLLGVLARVRAPGREAVRQGTRRLGAGGGGEQSHQVDRRDGHGPRARDVRLERRVRCEVRSAALSGRARASRAPRRGAGATRDAAPETSHSTPSLATPFLGSRSRAFARVVSRACFVSRLRDNPSRSRDPTSLPRGRNRLGSASPPRRADRASRDGLASRSRHDEMRLDSCPPTEPGETRPHPPSAVAHPPPSDPRATHSSSPAPVLFFSSSRDAAPRWTVPAACASWTSTTSPRP